MYGGTIYYWADDGTHKAPLIDFSTQLSHLSTVFGNTVFVFIYHHSIPGIIYPVRPQSAIPKMFLISNIFGAVLLFIEA
jgi:amino acid permease